METKYENGYLKLNISCLLEILPPEQKIEFIEQLSCDEAIIKHVMDQVLDNWTINCYRGLTSIGSEAEPRNSIDIFRREIAKRSSEIAKKEIEELEKSLKEEKEKYWKLVEETRPKYKY